MKEIPIFILICFLLTSSAFAQESTIQGVVSDSEGLPIPGVSVAEKGTSNGVVTDFDGEYSITVASSATLTFSYLGYDTHEIDVDGKSTIDVTMQASTSELDEVVVVGYGTQKKMNLTGSVASISGDELADRPVSNVGAALSGISPNLNINLSGALGNEPGAGMSWNIRGLGSLSGNDSPLILVDGVEMNINNLDPQNIESVSVLKDASASAIYGARAPFGVVLITTKRGRTDGNVSVQYNSNFIVSSMIGTPHMENSVDYATAYNQAAANAGSAPVFNEDQVERMRGFIDGSYPYEYDPDNPPNSIWAGRRVGNANYDYLHELLKQEKFDQKHNLTVSGGNEKTQFNISMGYFDEGGFYAVGYDEYERYDILANIDTEVNDWLSFGLNTKYAHSLRDFPIGITTVGRGNNFSNEMYHFAPNTPMYNIDGSRAQPIFRNLEAAGRDVTKENDMLIALNAELEPIEGWKTRLSYTYNYTVREVQSNPKPVWVQLGDGTEGNVGKPGTAYQSSISTAPYNLITLSSSYEKNIGDHYFQVLAGYEREEDNYYSQLARADNLITESVPSLSTALGVVSADDTKWAWATEAGFGRFNYNYQEKYLVEFSGRYNGSSRFSPDDRWGFFPSVSAGYAISEEMFWEPLEPYINRLKFRGSYGELGNQNVANYLYISSIPVYSQAPWILDGERPPYAQAPGMLSNNLTWETITTANFGVDAWFLGNRLELTFDYFTRKTSDMFGPQETLPYLLGASTPTTNNASLETKGFEVILKWRETLSNNFSYHAQLSLGDNKSTVTEYRNENGFISNWYAGKEVGEIWGYVSDGLIQSEGEDMPDQTAIYPNWGPGDMKYVDLNGDGEITPGTRTLTDHGDLKKIGNSSPRYNFGITGGFNWKGFDFYMQWNGVGKRDFVPNRASNTFWGMTHGWSSSAVFKGSPALDYWRPADETNDFGPNTDAYLPKPYFSGESHKNRETQSRYVLNASYLRLKNLQVGYTIPSNVTSKIYLQNVRVFLSGTNLLTFTDLPDTIDPEQGMHTYANGGAYPISQSFSLGLNLTF